VEQAPVCATTVGRRLTELLPYVDLVLAYFVQRDAVVAADGDLDRFRAQNQPRLAAGLAGGDFDRFVDVGQYAGWLSSHQHLLPASAATVDTGGSGVGG
jgi:hypothetical protein